MAALRILAFCFVVLFLALCATVAGVPRNSQRIIGGSTVAISGYPYMAGLLYSSNLVTYYQSCGGTILNTRSILTAGHCLYGDRNTNWRARVGSSYASSGGTVHTSDKLTVHSSFNPATLDNDVAILRTSSAITYVVNAVQPASIAGTNYALADNQALYASGWGTTVVNGQSSEQLRHVQIWSINQATCKSRYAELGPSFNVTDNMLCSGWLDVGGRDQCQGDSGGPLIHNGVIVGICSWGYQCALARYPGVNTRVSRFTTWIQANA